MRASGKGRRPIKQRNQLKNELYENKDASHRRPDWRGGLVFQCRSLFRLVRRPPSAGRGAAGSGGGFRVSRAGLRVGAGLLVGFKSHPLLGRRMLALSSRIRWLWPSLWLAPLIGRKSLTAGGTSEERSSGRRF